MIFYVAIASALFCLAYLRVLGTVDRRYEAALVLCLTLLAYLVSFMRWETGTDWPGYIAMFEHITTLENAREQSWWGLGYSRISVFVHSLGGGYSAFLFCIATLLYWTKFHVLKRSCAAPLVAVFVLFCTNFYDIYFVRQTVAIVFFWAFAYYYYRRNYSLSVGSAIIALLFHHSVALPVAIVLLVTRLHWKSMLAALIALSTLYLFAPKVDYLEIAGLGAYIGTGFVEEKASGLSTTFRSYLKLSFWMFFIVLAYAYLMRDEKRIVNYGWSVFCLKCGTGIIVATAILLPVSEVFARFPEYAMPLFAVVLSNYQFQRRQMDVASAGYLTILLLLFVQLGFYFSAYPDLYYPVKTILAVTGP